MLDVIDSLESTKCSVKYVREMCKCLNARLLESTSQVCGHVGESGHTFNVGKVRAIDMDSEK